MLRRLLGSRWLYPSLAGLLLLMAILAQVEVSPSTRPRGSLEDIAKLREREDLNLLFVLVDALRADRLSSYGYSRATSPTMDALAASGVRFARTVAQSSWTKSSMTSLWTGLYPVSTGVLRHAHALASEATLPAEILRDAGFRTAGIWRNGWVAPNFGFDQGFELYQRPQPGRRPDTLEHHNPSAHRLAGSDYDVTESALEFLRTSGHERWFLYLHYMDVHQYTSDEVSARFGTSYSDIYDNAIHWVDRNLGVLLAELEERGLLGKTLIVIASDHGEAFYEHGLEGHARNLYREVTETPFILSFPFRLDPGIVVRNRVENVDVWPTILDLLGLSPLPGSEGRSLVQLIEAAAQGREAPRDERAAFAHLDRTWGRVNSKPDPIVTVTDGTYRLVYHVNAPASSELFDHSTDPKEQANVAEQRPEVAASLGEEARAYLRRPVAPWGGPLEVEIDELELGQLRALGYVIKK